MAGAALGEYTPTPLRRFTLSNHVPPSLPHISPPLSYHMSSLSATRLCIAQLRTALNTQYDPEYSYDSTLPVRVDCEGRPVDTTPTSLGNNNNSTNTNSYNNNNSYNLAGYANSNNSINSNNNNNNNNNNSDNNNSPWPLPLWGTGMSPTSLFGVNTNTNSNNTNNQEVGMMGDDDDDYVDYHALTSNNNNNKMYSNVYTTTTPTSNNSNNFNSNSNNNNNNFPSPMACESFSLLLMPSVLTPFATGESNTSPPTSTTPTTTHALGANAAVLLGSILP